MVRHSCECVQMFSTFCLLIGQNEMHNMVFENELVPGKMRVAIIGD